MRVFTVKSKKLFAVVKIVIYGLKIIGLAPFRISIKSSVQLTTRNTRLQVFQCSKVGLVYNISLLISWLLAIWLVPPIPFEGPDTEGILIYRVTDVNEHVHRVLLISTACVIIIFWGIRQSKAASIMNRLLEIDLELSSFEKQPFNMRALIFLIIHVILTAFLWTFLFCTGIVDDDEFSRYLRYYVDLLLQCVIYYFIMEYSAVVGLVANDIETINKYLLNFKEFGNYISPPLFSSGQLATISTYCNSPELAFRKLNKYRDIRMRLVELCEDIGDFFSLPILCCIACCFQALFHDLYQLFSYTHNKKAMVGDATGVTLFIILECAYPVVSLALNVTRVRRESQLTKGIIDKLLEVTIRAEISSQLELFSRQLLHENVSFVAYGFFSLDSSLLLSLMASTMTYLVVLTQLPDGLYKNCSGSRSPEEPIIANRSES